MQPYSLKKIIAIATLGVGLSTLGAAHASLNVGSLGISTSNVNAENPMRSSNNPNGKNKGASFSSALSNDLQYAQLHPVTLGQRVAYHMGLAGNPYHENNFQAPATLAASDIQQSQQVAVKVDYVPTAQDMTTVIGSAPSSGTAQSFRASYQVPSSTFVQPQRSDQGNPQPKVIRQGKEMAYNAVSNFPATSEVVQIAKAAL